MIMLNVFSNGTKKLTISDEGEEVFKSENILKIAKFLIDEKPEEVEAFIFNEYHDSFQNLDSTEKTELKEILTNQLFKENNYQNSDDW